MSDHPIAFSKEFYADPEARNIIHYERLPDWLYTICNHPFDQFKIDWDYLCNITEFNYKDPISGNFVMIRLLEFLYNKKSLSGKEWIRSTKFRRLYKEDQYLIQYNLLYNISGDQYGITERGIRLVEHTFKNATSESLLNLILNLDSVRIISIKNNKFYDYIASLIPVEQYPYILSLLQRLPDRIREAIVRHLSL